MKFITQCGGKKNLKQEVFNMNFGFEFTILKFPCTTLILVYMVVIFYKHWVWICIEGIIGNVFVTRPGVSDSFNFWNIKLKYIKQFTMYLPPYKHQYVHIFASFIDSISKKVVGILMRTNCASLSAGLFSLSYEPEFV